MQNFQGYQMSILAGAALPLSILMMENDEDRQFLTEVYLQYRPLMYRAASPFFRDNQAEMDDAVSGAVERLCKKCDTIRAVACNKRASYIVTIVRNVCLSRLRQLKRQRLHLDPGECGEAIENVPDGEDLQELVFNRLLAGDLLNAFPELSEKERELIRMRHMDGLDYTEIAELTGLTESAARTAVCRAKKRLEALAAERTERCE